MTDVTVHHVDDIPWYEAPLPRRWHMCFIQTYGFIDGIPVTRCPCGSVRMGLKGRVLDKNQRRSNRDK